MDTCLHEVNRETCRGDGVCVEVCPEKVLETRDGKAATIREREKACILCGQCVAVCPNDALRMPKLPAEDFRDLPKPSFGYGEFLDFLKLRRSVRVFKNQPVDRELIDKVLEAAATAPMGLPPHSTEALVIDREEELRFLLKECVRDYSSVVKAFSNPIGRLMMRFMAGRENYGALKDYIVDLAKKANEAYRKDGSDLYTYNAPVLLLFHGSRRALSYEENANLICHYAMLAALSLGLGTTIIGLITPIVDRSKTLRKRWAIPKENKVVSALILGHPKYKYSKSIRRDLAGVRTV